MRASGMGWAWVALGLYSAACREEPGRGLQAVPPQSLPEQPRGDAGTDGGSDAPPLRPPPNDPQDPVNPADPVSPLDPVEPLPPEGPPDAGTPIPGPGDGGTPLPPTLSLPTLPGWQFYGPAQGGPRQVLGVSADRGGNIWVAGGEDGLYLLAPGASTFRRFTIANGLTPYRDPAGNRQQPVISVVGGEAGTVYAGYRGINGGRQELDPPYMVKSGDVDKVTFAGAGGAAIAVEHYDIYSPKGEVPGYNEDREKVRDVYRMLYDPRTGDVWFGGNHGVSLYDGVRRRVVEHVHPMLNGYTASGHYTGLSDLYKGLALDARGNLWLGGANRTAKLPFATNGRNLVDVYEQPYSYLDIWPDAKSTDARASERTDDYVEDMAITPDGSFWVGSIPNGLARLSPAGRVVQTVREGMVDPKVTALEHDPQGGALWVGHIYGGVTRLLPSGGRELLDFRAFGGDLVQGVVPDIQSDTFNGQRRILVAFSAGAVGVYTGP